MTCLAFDIDGTIFDCSEIVVDAFQEGISVFRETGRKDILIPDKQKIKSVLGIPHDLIFRRLFEGLEESELQRINDLCTESLVKYVNRGEGEIFSGVHSTLELLFKQGYKIYAASNGNQQYVEAVLKSNDLIDYFLKPIVVLGSVIKSKSDILKYYKDNNCSNDLLIMIGDRYTDRIAAQDNEVPFIGCVFGHADSSELEGSRWLIHDFSSIYNLVKNIEKEYLHV